MSEKIHYEESGSIDKNTPLEPFYNALLPLLSAYGFAEKFPANKPSLGSGGYTGDEFSVWIGDLPGAFRYTKIMPGGYSAHFLEQRTIESEGFAHGETGEEIFIRIDINNNRPSAEIWMNIEFKGERKEVGKFRKSFDSALSAHKFKPEKLEIKSADGKIFNSLNELSAETASDAQKSGGKDKSFEETESPDDGYFDELSRKANESGGAMEVLNELFGAAFALEKWLFISRGEFPNVNPYVASHPDTAGGQPMIRVFTSNKRLLRFARENNLTKADETCDSLSIPTKGIIEYLEQFISYGVYGAWFNSDSQSDGFFVPIKQLQPIKDHLAKINGQEKNAQKSEITTLRMIVEEGLMLPSGEIKLAPYRSSIFWRVPTDWIENGKIKAEHRRTFEKELSGGNSETIEGAFYVATDYETKIFTPEEVKTTDWRELEKGEDSCTFFIISEKGEAQKVSAEDFQKNFDSENQTAEKEAAQMRQDSLADWGMSQAPNGDFELNLKISKVGTVGFDTAIAPFYEAIVPLLKDFRGTGDYVSLLHFAPNGKSRQVENIVENSHGSYLQIRRFLYLNPKNKVRIGVNSIHSNQLRHVRSNAELLVSIELCKNLDNQTAAFYHALQGPKSDVLRLAAAIQPLLETNNYQAVR